MNKEQFIKEVEKLGIKVSDESLILLDKYYNFLSEYNKHTNLTRITSESEVYLKHFYDSLTITKVIDLENENTLLDIGSGAGFPGVVLKIFFPNLEVSLLDSNNKKTKFLTLLCGELNLEINIVCDRAENHTKKFINYYDVVVARAVANLRVLAEITIPLVKENGYFIAMKANAEEEIKDCNNTLKIMRSETIKCEKFILPVDESNRTIILIKKLQLSKLKNLRTYEKILKSEISQKIS